MNILETIVAHKINEVAGRKNNVPVQILEASRSFTDLTVSMRTALLDTGASGIIAEFKRKSPSKGIINASASIEKITRGYASAGASALSILTDNEFFGGANDDLITARRLNAIPLLRKDFIVDEYQIIESKSIGADVILLIAAVLQPNQVKQYVKQAHSLGLEVLLEVHNEEELIKNLDSAPDMIGVNNRNLKTFEVSVETSRQLVDKIPNEIVKISESGIETVTGVQELKELGFQGFLMGQYFMKHEHPEKVCTAFIGKLKMLEDSKSSS